MNLTTYTHTEAGRRAIANGRGVLAVKQDVQPFADREVWRAESLSTRDGEYEITLNRAAGTIDCTCPAGTYDRCCKHAGSVLIASKLAWWWTELHAERDERGRVIVYLSDGGSWGRLLANSADGIDWGSLAGQSGLWRLARVILSELTDDATTFDRLTEPMMQLLADQPRAGFIYSPEGFATWMAMELDSRSRRVSLEALA